MKTSVTQVANITPNARLTAIGIKNFAWMFRFEGAAETPAAVVKLVRQIGRKRRAPASRTA
ncbi:MAG: hypothetical protein H6833_06850 [Planctomycetes bacterium]|nr:hypothetical protein [Planctomycetota bacterium]